MQRKNYFLKTSHKKSFRSAMAMIMAIVVLVVITTIMALSLSLSTQTTKRTTDLYLYEQSVLLSQSAAEYAMLKISQQNPCSLSNLDFRYNETYDVNITMSYVYFNGSNCDIFSTSDYTAITYPNSDGSVLMDITITANPDGTTEPIRYFRRSIQKL
ncbi:MAG: type II secretory pathway pseudopilin PulG [Sulfurimonas sp.]|jgi:type II secretory pathway pseudopilin PulG